MSQRIHNERLYECSLIQSLQPADYIFDTAKFGYCQDINTIPYDELDTPITTVDKCYVQADPSKKPIVIDTPTSKPFIPVPAKTHP